MKKKKPALKKENEDCKNYVKDTFFIPNGCGPKLEGWKGIFSFLIPEFVFKICCNCHDFTYFVGGCKKYKKSARFDGDSEFLANMKEVIKTKTFFRRPVLLKLADLYNWAVRKWGHESFAWFPTVQSFADHLFAIGFELDNIPGLHQALRAEWHDENYHKGLKNG